MHRVYMNLSMRLCNSAATSTFNCELLCDINFVYVFVLLHSIYFFSFFKNLFYIVLPKCSS